MKRVLSVKSIHMPLNIVSSDILPALIANDTPHFVAVSFISVPSRFFNRVENLRTNPAFELPNSSVDKIDVLSVFGESDELHWTLSALVIVIRSHRFSVLLFGCASSSEFNPALNAIDGHLF